MRDETASMNDRTTGWTETGTNNDLYLRYRFALVGLASGLVGGMGAFVFSRSVVAPRFLGLDPQLLGMVLSGLGGAFAYVLALEAKESAKAMIIGFGVALLVLLATRLVPLWMLPFPPAARDFIIKDQLQYVAHTVFNVLILVYWGGYLAALSLFGYLDY